jgi:hypothetical protein
LLVVPFAAGLLDLEKAWLAPLFMAAAQSLAQFAGGESWLAFESNEGPFIVLFGLPFCSLFLIAGSWSRRLVTLIRQHG